MRFPFHHLQMSSGNAVWGKRREGRERGEGVGGGGGGEGGGRGNITVGRPDKG